MSELVVYQGSKACEVASSWQNCYVYYIGPGTLLGGKFHEINNAERLNRIARNLAPKYAEWIYSLRHTLSQDAISVDELSLFFLTDLSCKRSEFFKTFNQICNLALLREVLEELSCDSIRLIGTDKSFNSAFRSINKGTPIIESGSPEIGITAGRRAAADCAFFFKALAVMGINAVRRTKGDDCSDRSGSKREMFLSFFPSMFKEGRELKYGSLVQDQKDLAFMIIADGMHQKISLAKYWKLANQVEAIGSTLVDRYLRPTDFLRSIVWGAKMWIWCALRNRDEYRFDGLDVTLMVREELWFSVSRVMRLGLLKGSVSRVLNKQRPKKLFFYPPEYPLGRLISWVVAQTDFKTISAGYQMGIVSLRRTENYMAVGEARSIPPFFHHAPVPNEMWVEDERAENIYQSAGYRKIRKLTKAFRYDQVTKEKRNENSKNCLIAPGLHDGSILLEVMRNRILQDKDIKWIWKPHPRGDRGYLSRAEDIRNLEICERPVSQLLSEVSEVFVTYSSVGVESRHYGLKTTVINIPGYVSFSPLLD